MVDQTPEDLKELGNKAFAAKEYRKAIGHYTQAIKLDASNHVFFSNRSACYAGLSDWRQSADDAKECIRLDPTFVKGYYRLVNAQIELRELEGAMATIRQGLTVEPHNSQLTKQSRVVQQLLKVQNAKKSSSSSAAAAADKDAAPTAPQRRAKGDALLDDATNHEVLELQKHYAQTTRELQVAQANLTQYQNERKVGDITMSEVQSLPDGARCYRAVGKAFLASTKASTVRYLQTKHDVLERNATSLTQKAEYLERRAKSQRQNMQELLAPAMASGEVN